MSLNCVAEILLKILWVKISRLELTYLSPKDDNKGATGVKVKKIIFF